MELRIKVIQSQCSLVCCIPIFSSPKAVADNSLFEYMLYIAMATKASQGKQGVAV